LDQTMGGALLTRGNQNACSCDEARTRGAEVPFSLLLCCTACGGDEQISPHRRTRRLVRAESNARRSRSNSDGDADPLTGHGGSGSAERTPPQESNARAVSGSGQCTTRQTFAVQVQVQACPCPFVNGAKLTSSKVPVTDHDCKELHRTRR
jgi:hypothetical protein